MAVYCSHLPAIWMSAHVNHGLSRLHALFECQQDFSVPRQSLIGPLTKISTWACMVPVFPFGSCNCSYTKKRTSWCLHPLDALALPKETTYQLSEPCSAPQLHTLLAPLTCRIPETCLKLNLPTMLTNTSDFVLIFQQTGRHEDRADPHESGGPTLARFGLGAIARVWASSMTPTHSSTLVK